MSEKPSKVQVDGTPVEPDPEEPAPEVPAPEVPAPEVPAPEVPAPEVPAPEVPAPEVPAPEVPAPEVPAPEVPAPEVPAPEEPAPEVPAPEQPVPEQLVPEEPSPVEPSSKAPTPLNAIESAKLVERADDLSGRVVDSNEVKPPPPPTDSKLVADKSAVAVPPSKTPSSVPGPSGSKSKTEITPSEPVSSQSKTVTDPVKTAAQSKALLSNDDAPPPLPDSSPPTKGYEFTEAEQTLALAPDTIPDQVPQEALTSEQVVSDEAENKPQAVSPSKTASGSEEAENKPQESPSKTLSAQKSSPEIAESTPSSVKTSDSNARSAPSKVASKTASKAGRTAKGSGGAGGGSLLYEKDGGWILEKMGEAVPKSPGSRGGPGRGGGGPAGRGGPGRGGSGGPGLKMPLNPKFGSDSSDRFNLLEYEDWYLDKMHLDSDPLPKATKGSKTASPSNANLGSENGVNGSSSNDEKDGNWVLEKLDVEKLGISKRTLTFPPGPKLVLPVSQVGAKAEGATNGNDMDTDLNPKPKGDLSRLGFGGTVVSTQSETVAHCDLSTSENCCQDPKLEPFCKMVRSAMFLYDAITSCDLMGCNDCDPPKDPEGNNEPGLFDWIGDLINDLIRLSNGNSSNPAVEFGEGSEGTEGGGAQPDPCS